MQIFLREECWVEYGVCNPKSTIYPAALYCVVCTVWDRYQFSLIPTTCVHLELFCFQTFPASKIVPPPSFSTCHLASSAALCQVLEAYMAYGDSMIGRWEMKEDGWRSPGVRALIRPIMGLFHGAPNVRKWKQSVDAALKTATSVSGLLKVRLLEAGCTALGTRGCVKS